MGKVLASSLGPLSILTLGIDGEAEVTGEQIPCSEQIARVGYCPDPHPRPRLWLHGAVGQQELLLQKHRGHPLLPLAQLLGKQHCDCLGQVSQPLSHIYFGFMIQ